MDRTCSKCGTAKPETEFSSNGNGGLRGDCKACCAAACKAWKRKNRDAERASSRRSYRNNISAAREARRRWMDANAEAHRAHAAVQRALAAGVLERPGTCESCGEECRPDAHHDDYARPLDVVWLCRSCHQLAHAAEAA